MKAKAISWKRYATIGAMSLACVSWTCPSVGAQTQNQTAVKEMKQQNDIASRLDDFEKSLGTTPTDAYIDRVWHLVPGISGWQLNKPESERRTALVDDGKLHLVWNSISPKVSLSTLGAEPIYRGPKTEKSVSLMVNVSWGEEYVPKMLQIFRQSHVHATFFLDGDWVEKHPQLVEQMLKDGHAIGSHGTGHPDFRQLSNSKLAWQLEETNKRIENLTAKKTVLIAPPSGSYDSRLVKMAKERGMYTILWTADTVDWKRPPAEVIVARAKRGLKPGSLILMHPTAQTVEALPKMVKMIQTSGYHIKTVMDVVQEKPAVQPPAVLSTVR